ncbi:MAG: dimethyl sulfoxide reductase anchor subunit family protein [Gemmobacter sp.]
MHPAPSVILFTVLSGLGFGLLGFLALGVGALSGWGAFAAWGLGAGLAVAGLTASTFHLGNPQRALLAFTQWRTSWLSREAWAAVLTLMVLAPAGLGDWLGFPVPTVLRVAGAAGCVATVVCTAMIYASLRSIPRWHWWITPVLFLAFAATGGMILAVGGPLAALMALVLAGLLVWTFAAGDRRFAAAGSDMGSATGLGRIGTVRVFEQPHTGGNYLTREMIHVVGRRHAGRLRVLAVALAGLGPALVLLAVPGLAGQALAAALHVAGAFAARWLFFAEAEHVVGLYYGARG